jgi:uridine phosphorylase
MYLIRPEQVEIEALRTGLTKEELTVPETIILTFNQSVLSELKESCQLEKWEWKANRFSPYSNPQASFKGEYEGIRTAVMVPPMGASPLVALCEELVYFGAEVLMLVCASWGLGESYLKKGMIHIPSFSVGLNGTSSHYGSKNLRVKSEGRAFSALSDALEGLEVEWKSGGVGCCEAIYRITKGMCESFRGMGCLSIENGETAALYSLARQLSIPIGVLLQPYIDLNAGWSVSYLDQTYKQSGRFQAQAALGAIQQLRGT